jgi:peptide/nickel transport system ATP-binding protein/glutathione transport system ATP-binding protein
MKDIVSVDYLRVEFATDGGTVVGVEDVCFTFAPGETLCVIGKSGSGKSVTSLSLMRLVGLSGGSITQGALNFVRADGSMLDVATASSQVKGAVRGNEIGMTFQEPMTALNPVFTIERQLTDGMMLHKGIGQKEAISRALAILKSAHIPKPERRLRQYPHELSGGMRQRVVIAMAMACEPKLLIADEPTTALDVTIQAEILALISRLKRENGMAVLFIAHDMAVVAQMANRVVVMYRGRIVETGPVQHFFWNPRENYTKVLLAAVPKLGEMTGKPAPELMRLIGDEAARAAQRAAKTAAHPRKPEVLLEVKNLTTRFPVKGGILRRTVAQDHAVKDVSFMLNAGETLALVGESGCGKSSCGRSILRLIKPTSGKVWIGGRDIGTLTTATCAARALTCRWCFRTPLPASTSVSASRRRWPNRSGTSDLPRMPNLTPACRNFPNGSACRATASIAFRTNFRAGSASALPSPARWP